MATIPYPGTGLPAILRRPRATTGLVGWLATVDHKKIGVLYGVTAFIFFLLGGIEALVIRVQLARPELDVITADFYNQMFTMHGTTMVFLVIMPMSAAFFNFLVPLMIGARDVAFPRLNALSYWLFLFGGLFIYSSFFLGGAPNTGWYGYAPLTEKLYNAGHGVDYWLLGLQILGIASLASAFNFIVTILNMRAPGMTLLRMPIFVWMTLVVAFLLITAIPPISVALFELGFDRFFGTAFFDWQKGGDPVLWQHLFWLFGHPEVYILILPAMGIVSEVLPTFSRKPLFGYAVVVFSGVAIGFMGWGVWAHHMFVVGLGPVANAAFATSTMLIAVPTGVKIFNWLGTLWGGRLSFKTPLAFAIGFVAMFIIGGLSGVTHAVVPADTQQNDTYYIVAHFHYVLFGGAIFGLFAGIYYWWPKLTGKTLNEGLGMLHFWLMLIGFNLTFGPMHIVGLNGMPRRTFTYPEGMGWDFWNLVETIGAFVIAASILVFMVNVLLTARKKERAPIDPWNARTLEWAIPSPPPAYNFSEIPVVHARDEFWHRKYYEDAQGRAVPREDYDPSRPVFPALPEHGHGHGHGHGIHMPSPSYFPLIAALGLPVMAYGLIAKVSNEYLGWTIIGIGALLLFLGVYGWGLEPVAEEE
jgi:cytochrome c oxidase subunit 1